MVRQQTDNRFLPKDILACLRRVEDRGTIETAHRTLQICGQVFRYAVATSRIDRDITPDLRGALPTAKGDHFAAITEPKQVAEQLHPLTGHGRFIFPSERTPRGDRCMSDNTLNGALKRLGYGKDTMTAHGFRAMARTILDEVLEFRPDFIEHQLAHAVKDPNGRAYNRTVHLQERHKMMQSWSGYPKNRS